MSLFEMARESSKCILSVMGPHAGENPEEIFKRKKKDIERVKKTFWLINSNSINPCEIQEYCKSNKRLYIFFINPSAVKAARPAIMNIPAVEYSTDRQTWIYLPEGLSKVTGRLTQGTKTLIMDKLEMCDKETIDLWDYAENSEVLTAIRFRLGNSTIFAKKCNASRCDNIMISRYREIYAVGRLCEHFCAWVR